MERRVLLAIFLSFLVLYAYQAFFSKPAPKAPQTASAQPDAAATAAKPPAVADVAVPESAAVLGETVERDVRLETAQFVAVFTNRGARLKSWRLKKFRGGDGQPLEMVVHELSDSQPLPFSLRTSDRQTTALLNGALYAVKEGDGGGPVTTVAFEYQNVAGLSAVKTFQVGAAPYETTFRAEVRQQGNPIATTVQWGPGLGDRDSQTGRYAVKPGGLYSVAGKVSRLSAKNINEQPSHQQVFDYAGIDDHYFTSIALKPGAATATYQTLSIPPAAGTKDPTRDMVAYSLDLPPTSGAVTFYIGPKEFETLSSIDPGLVKTINFGMFSVLVVPLLRSLNWIHGFVGNYGWAITVLTVLINLVLFPLNHKSVVSMRKMQEVQPEAKAIQDRYAKLKTTDPARQKMNQELMALYRERGVNPASGCIPILLTLPVFLAFYAMLQTAIELRGAPFVGWIHDLSLPDAYYVLPVLVGLSQFVTQWMTPQAGVDPAQQKMMLIMPLVLIFVFVSTPAGALIYWLVGNVWRIGQMQLTNYLIGPPVVRTVRPAAERRVKRVGTGKTEGAAREN